MVLDSIFHKKIFPSGIILFNQPHFLFSAPLFDLLLPGDGISNFCKAFQVNQFIDVKLFRKPGVLLFNVLMNPE